MSYLAFIADGVFWVVKKTYYYAIFALLIVFGVSLPFILRARPDTFADRFLVAFQGLIIVTLAAWLAAKATFFGGRKAKEKYYDRRGER